MTELRSQKRPVAKSIADLLAGSWRSPPPPLPAASPELQEALTLVARTKAGALTWWRLRDTSFALLPEVEALHDAYRYAALQAQFHEVRVSSVFRALRAVSIEPILIKGWDVARLYPQSGLRLYEDIDLIVRPEHQPLAETALRSNGMSDAVVDFDHAEISVFDSGDWDGLYERSRVVALAGVDIRVLSPEDHLRALCIHGLKHCFSNPLWLCDVAVSVEATGAAFDWERCFGKRHPQDQWIGCALALARDLLGCELPAQPAQRVDPLPRWLVPIVLDTWIRWAMVGPDKRWAVREILDNPVNALAVVARRWPNQLVVRLKRRAPLADGPPWLQRLHEFGYLFEGKRLVEALLRKSPERSTP
ncbi:MAG TPA: nucleotidyltransferase family protein [Candidatus Baltobacteraceae bacterium]|nr:nucleotidyltransferase family protein [Candidatus Baltobacteraceae bacterium]